MSQQADMYVDDAQKTLSSISAAAASDDPAATAVYALTLATLAVAERLRSQDTTLDEIRRAIEGVHKAIEEKIIYGGPEI